MKLLVDIGNTNIKWRLGGRVQLGEAGQWQRLLANWASLPITDLFVSCVKSDVWRDEFAEACRTHLGIDPSFAMVQRIPGAPDVAYEDLSTFGVDRWLGLWAACAHTSTAFALISAGSALTVDYVSADRRHLGGLIAPGLAMSARALDRGTGKIGRQEWAGLNMSWQPGVSTAACVKAGLSAVYKGLMEEVSRHAAQLDAEPSLILTGGDAEVLRALLAPDARVHVSPFLVLDGLRLLSDASESGIQ